MSKLLAPFREGYRVTQFYNENPEYYSQFYGEDEGHKGLDLVPPTWGKDWIIYPFANGVIVVDIDDEDEGQEFGVNVTIWYEEFDLAVRYCHLEQNYVTKNQRVTPVTPIGKMGDTGTGTGAHLHAVLIPTKNGYRQKEFGTRGRIDPWPFFLAMAGPPVQVKRKSWGQWVNDNPEYRGQKPWV